MTVNKTVKDQIEEQVAAEQPTDFVVPGNVLQSAVNTLAELPYKQVGDLLNALRSCKPV